MKKYLTCMLWVLVCLSLNAQGVKKEKFSSRERLINEYYMMADSCYKCGNFVDAIKYAQQGTMSIKNKKKSRTTYVNLRVLEAISYNYLGNFNMALIAVR